MTNSEYDFNEILTRIEGRFDKIEVKINKLQEDVRDLQQEVRVLAREVEQITKRLDTKEHINRGMVIGVVLFLMWIAFLNRR